MHGIDPILPLDFVVVCGAASGTEVQAFASGTPHGAARRGARLVLHHAMDPGALRAWESTGALCLPAERALMLFAPEEPDGQVHDPLGIGARWVRAAHAIEPHSEMLRLASEVLPPEDAGLRALLHRALLHIATSRPGGSRPEIAHDEAGTTPRGDVSPRSWSARDSSPLEDPAWGALAPHARLDRALEHLQSWRRGDGKLPFERRAGQVEMAHAVLDALLEGGNLVVEAGTGTGKTIAYALPAVLVAAAGGRRVLVSTHTRNLQEQLVARDLPELWRCLGLEHLPRPDGDDRGLRFAKLLGRENYVCRTALRRAARQAAATGGSFALAQLLLWTLRGGRELEEIAARPGFDPRLLRDLASRREVCEGRACRGEPCCPVYAARDAARRADLVVVNHALLFSDARAEGSIVGPYDALIVDESHHLEAVATEQLSLRLGRAQAEALLVPLVRLNAVLREIPGDGAGAPMRLRLERYGSGVVELRSGIGALLDALDAGLRRPQQARGRQRYRDGDEVFGPVREMLYALLERIAARMQEGSALCQEAEENAAADPIWLDVSAALGRLVALQRETRSVLEFLARGDDEAWAFWLDFGNDGGRLREIVAAPLEVARDVQRLLSAPGRGTVYTSATLALGGRFDYFESRIGLGRETAELAVPSPFDYASQCLVVQAQFLDDYAAPRYLEQAADLLGALVRRTGRRTLVLLTAHAALRGLHSEIEQRLGGEAPLLAQELSGARARIAARFAATPGAVLLGTSSFWEGVDFPGAALEILAIAKLPFLVPEDALVAARCERLRARGEDPFACYVLPEAVLRFQQGFGRLIRTRHDRGVVVLLDSRLGERDYGAEFLRALPVAAEVFFESEALVQRVVDWFAPAPATADGAPASPAGAIAPENGARES